MWPHEAQRVSRAFLSSFPRAGVLNIISMATPLRRSRTSRDPGGLWSRAGRAHAGTECAREYSVGSGKGFFACLRCLDGGGTNPYP